MNKRTKLLILLIIAVLAGVAGTAIMLHAHHASHMAATTGTKIIYQCPMHPQYLSDKPGTCPICGMTLVPVKETGEAGAKAPAETAVEAGTVKIDPTVVQNIGVTTEVAALRDLKRDIRASAVIGLNETAVTNVNTKIMGWVEKLYVDYTGQRVGKGQPLLTLYSPDLVSTQEEYLQALRYQSNLTGGSMEAGMGANALVESSKRRLLNWDIPEADIDAIAKSGVPRKTLTIYSPAGGVVIEKQVQAGQNVTPGMELYKIADLGNVWAIADVYQEDLPFVKVGAGATLEVSSAPGRTFTGRVEFIAPMLDAATRTAPVRVAIRNTPDFILKPQMFATIKIASTAAVRALSVSQASILHTGKRDVVIVALGGGYFRPVEVRLGVSANGYTQILSGLEPKAIVVTSSQFLIDAESNLKQAVGMMNGAAASPANTDGR